MKSPCGCDLWGRVMKKIKILVVPLAILLLLSGCGTNIEEKLNTSDILVSGTTENDPYSSEYLQIAENENISFFFNRDTTGFKVVDKSNGYEWFSTNRDKSELTSENAPFVLSYVSSQGQIESIDAVTGSILSGQYEYERTDKGIKVTYSVGDFSELLLVPLAIDKSRKETILKKIDDEFKRGQFDIMYQQIDYKNLDEENKKTFSQKYPTIKDETLYILRESITSSDSKMKDLAMLLNECGYSEEMYKEDSRLFKSERSSDSEKQPRFRIQICYTLTEDGINITVPEKEIQMNSSCPLVGIELHKYMFSPSPSDDGYFLLPDGSGSIMNFYNGRGDLQPYNTKVYGIDYSSAISEYVYNYEQSYLPVWGVKNGSNAAFAVIENGAAIAEITAHPGNDRLSAYATCNFGVRAYQKSYLSSNTGQSNYFVNVQNKRYTDDISIRLVFLNGGKANYSGMADWYRTYLFGTEDLQKTNEPALLVECVGLIDKQTQTFGIKHTEKYAATTFEQAGDIVLDLKKSGIEDIKLKLSGWCNGPYYGGYAGNMLVNEKLGGREELVSLSQKLSKSGIDFYPDMDFQYTYKNSAFDGFSKKNDVVELITHATGYRVDFNPATFCRDAKYKTPAYINNASSVKKAVDSFLKKYEDLNIDGISMAKAGRELNSDFSDKNSTDREIALKGISEILKKVDKKHSIMTSGANAYILKNTDYCSDVPLVSNERDNTDVSVPFLQMVISGNVRYSGQAVNFSGGSENLWLRMAAVAADPYYVLTNQYGEQVRDSDYSFLYCSDYNYLKNDILEDVKEYQQKLSGVSGRRLIDYIKLSDDLYRSVFEDGYTVTVNFSNEDVSYENRLYSAKSYQVEKTGEVTP